jgi:hypothetical protein
MISNLEEFPKVGNKALTGLWEPLHNTNRYNIYSEYNKY